MAAPAPSLQPLLERLAALKAGFPAAQWSWDGRFEAVAITFRSNVEGQARTSAALALPHVWSAANVAEAPEALREICDSTGGLRAGQLLLGGNAVEGLTPYGLWWPWNGGGTLTLRISLAGVEAGSDALAHVRAALGVAA